MSARQDGEGEPFCHYRAIALFLLGIRVLAVVAWADEVGYITPPYAAAIDTVSGLGDHGGNSTLEPPFCLTFRVSYRILIVTGSCVGAGATVEVTYAGVSLATGPVPPLCPKPRHYIDQRIVASGTAVHVQGFTLDGLAADARRGVQAFDVAVWMPGTLVSCRGLRVGDTDALGSLCAASSVEPQHKLPGSKGAGES